MSDTLALIALYDRVVASFANDSIAVPQFFGWREPTKHQGIRRIVWVPGDDGDMGEFGPARNPGRNARSLGTLNELVTVYVQTVDTGAHETERDQYVATRLLFDAWYRAVYLAARGTFEMQSCAWVENTKERRFGAIIRVVLSVEAMIPDEIQESLDAGAKAEMTVREVDNTEVFDVPVYVPATPAPIPFLFDLALN